MSEKGHSVAAYAVITDDEGKVLLARRRAGGEWVLPGASVKAGEPPWEAGVREVREEAGLRVSVSRLVGVYVKRCESELVLVFKAAAVGGELPVSDERDRLGYFDPDRLPHETGPHEARRITDALAATDFEPVLAVQESQGDDPPAGTR